MEILRKELERVQAAYDLTLWTNAPVTEIRQDANGRVCGVTVFRDGRDIEIDAPHVVIATGGFGSDPELFAELEGSPLVSAAYKTSTGDGIHLARALGAGLQGKGTYLPTFGGLPDPRTPGRANWGDRQRLTSERPPFEIYVNRDGRRWVAEDEPSIDEKERALTTIPDQTFWTVFDDHALSQSTGPMEMIVGYGPDEVRAMMNKREGLHSADTIEELAKLAGINPANLVETVARYNEAVARGVDEEFGRKHLPAPIAQPPFYAIRNHGITLVTFVGLDIDDTFTVRNEAGERIEGLYAIGEVIGAGATCGNSFCSGMLVTPALTFGRLLGRRLAAVRLGAPGLEGERDMNGRPEQPVGAFIHAAPAAPAAARQLRAPLFPAAASRRCRRVLQGLRTVLVNDSPDAVGATAHTPGHPHVQGPRLTRAFELELDDPADQRQVVVFEDLGPFGPPPALQPNGGLEVVRHPLWMRSPSLFVHRGPSG